MELVRHSIPGTCASKEDMEAANLIGSNKWATILEKKCLKPGYPETRHNFFTIDCPETWTHLRINMYPDGGIARFKAFGIVKPNWKLVQSPCDLASLVNGYNFLSIPEEKLYLGAMRIMETLCNFFKRNVRLECLTVGKQLVIQTGQVNI